MLLDNNLIFSGTLAYVAGQLAPTYTGQSMNGAGNVLSTNYMDYGAVPSGSGQSANGQFREFGPGQPVELGILVTSAPTVGTSVQFQLVQDSSNAFGTTPQVVVQTDAIAIATLPINTLIPLHWDRAAPYVPLRFLTARVSNVGAIATAAYVIAPMLYFQDLMSTHTYTSGFAVL